MSYRIGGFTQRGEVRILDDRGYLVGYGELRLEDAHLTGVDAGDTFPLTVHVTWTPGLPDPDEFEIDWDGLLP